MFLGGFMTDLTYWKSAEMTWASSLPDPMPQDWSMGRSVGERLRPVDGRLVGMHRPTLGYLVGKVIILAFSFFNAWFTAAMPGHPLCRWFWPVGCRGGPDGGNKPH